MKTDYIEQIAAALQAPTKNSPVPVETILVCASRSEGRRIISAVTAQGHILVGVRPETPFTLAQELCATRMSQPDAPRYIEEVEGTELVRGCLRKTAGLFSDVSAKSLTATRAFFRTFQEMAMAGFPDKLKGRPELESYSKLQELMRLRTTYIRKKAAQNLFDRADLFRLALKLAEKKDGAFLRRAHYVVLGDYAPAFLEKQLLQKLAGEDRLTVVELPQTQYLDPETEEQFRPYGAMGIRPDDFIPQECIGMEDVRYVACRGVETETRFPFRDILETEKKLDDCAIVYLSGSYAQPLYEEAARFEMPVTMGGGLPLMGSMLYTTLKSIRDLPLSGYYAEDVCTLLENGSLMLDWRVQMAERLRRKKVGWGKERYLPAMVFEEQACPPDADEAAWKKQQEELKARMEKWEKCLRLLLAVTDPTGELEEQRKDLLKFLPYCNHASIREAAAMAKAKELTEQIMGLEENETILSRLLSLMETGSYMNGRVEPGKLYCAPLSQAAFINRKYLYVMGFSRYAMQGRRRESPVLLDKEREILNEMMTQIDAETNCGFAPLKTTIQQGREQEFRLLQMLGRHGKSLILSYPDFESDGMLALEPAPFFKQLSKDKLEHVTYYPQKRFILPTDDILAREGMVEIAKPMGMPVDSSWKAMELQPAKGRKAQMEELPFSATMLEDAARCPYAFYLSRLLHIRSPQEVKRNEDTWLSPADIGTFCHAVLEEYYVDPVNNSLDALFEKYFEVLKQEIPIPRKKLVEEARVSMLTMLQNAIAWGDSAENVHGYGKDVLATEEEFKDLPMTFNHWTLKMRGSIDRVDRLENGDLAIVDYKTGSPDKFKDELHKHWQHYLYTMARELRYPDDHVTRAGYLMLHDDAEIVDMEETDAKRKEVELRIAWVLDQVVDEKFLPACQPCYELYKDNKPPAKQPLGAMKKGSNGIALNKCKSWCEFAMICPKQKGGMFDDD